MSYFFIELAAWKHGKYFHTDSNVFHRFKNSVSHITSGFFGKDVSKDCSYIGLSLFCLFIGFPVTFVTVYNFLKFSNICQTVKSFPKYINVIFWLTDSANSHILYT